MRRQIIAALLAAAAATAPGLAIAQPGYGYAPPRPGYGGGGPVEQRWSDAQERYRAETERYNAEWDRYRRARGLSAGAPPPYGPGYGGGGQGGYGGGPGAYANDDRYENGYDPSRYYRNGPNYQERALGTDDRVYAGSDGRYYCRRSDGTTGLIVGGAAGGVLGNVIDGGHSRTAGTLLGAAAGALLGRSVDQQNQSIRCR